MTNKEAFTQEFILDLFKKTDALLEGHFKLSSGFHSNIYLQCAKVTQYPEINSILSTIIAEHYKHQEIDVVIGPALGGVVLSYEIAKKLNCRNIFTERVNTEDGKIMTLRRGFEIRPNEKVLITEDVITTGKSIKEVIEIVEKAKAKTAGIAGIVDRTNNTLKLHPQQFFVVPIEAEKYDPNDCPLCKNKVPLESPGSRFV